MVEASLAYSEPRYTPFPVASLLDGPECLLFTRKKRSKKKKTFAS